MKFVTFCLTFGAVVGAATVAQAQGAAAQPDALTVLQSEAGAIVGEAFRRPDPLVAAVSYPGSPAVTAGVALRTSMQVPGAVFAGIMQPLVAVDKALDGPATR